MSDKDVQSPFRLALRVEDEWWIAYMARIDTMEGAVELGRILFNCARVEGVGDAFKALMVQVLSGALEAIGANAISWDERKAPESERSGSA